MKGYKSVGVTKHKTPNNHRDRARQAQFRQKSRHAAQMGPHKLQEQKPLLSPPLLSPVQEVAL